MTSKQFGKLVELIADLQINGSKVHLVLIGDGPERPALEKLAAELDILASVTFTGEVPLAKQWLPAFDLFVFTSVDEGMPNVVLEAGAAGLPIVTWKSSKTKKLGCWWKLEICRSWKKP